MRKSGRSEAEEEVWRRNTQYQSFDASKPEMHLCKYLEMETVVHLRMGPNLISRVTPSGTPGVNKINDLRITVTAQRCQRFN